MKWLSITLLSLCLAGCGTSASQQYPEETSFFMVSVGEASLLYKIFGGGLKYCKVTQHNLDRTDFQGDVQWDGDECVVDISAEDK